MKYDEYFLRKPSTLYLTKRPSGYEEILRIVTMKIHLYLLNMRHILFVV